MDFYQEPPTPAPRKRYWHPAMWIGVAVAAAVTAGLLITMTSGSGSATVTVHGTMTLTDSSGGVTGETPCNGSGGYSDIADGAQVVISDDTGKTLTIVQLTGGVGFAGVSCVFDFTAKVPAGKSYYGVTVTHRGTVKMSEAELATAAVTLGN